MHQSPELQRRASDQSKWLKLSNHLYKYKIIVWGALIFLVAFGFDFTTPKVLFERITSRQSELERKDSVLSSQISDMKETVQALVTLQCLSLSKRDGKLTNLCP